MMKYLTYLLLWLSVLTFCDPAHATEAAVLPATAAAPTLALPARATQAPIGAQEELGSELPPPPPVPDAPIEAPPATTATGVEPIAHLEQQIPQDSPPQPSNSTRDGTISFALSAAPASVPPAAPTAAPAPTPPAATRTAAPALDALFDGNENSLVAKAVGSAEGTRTPDGGRNPAYYGHPDPGNGVWNLGSFSYQHAAHSPEEADAKQLARLRAQADQLLQNASDKGFSLTLSEKLNGIDLANQAPLAALGQQGYVDWLAVAKAEGKPEADAVLSARVRSFLDPRTQRWNAPGLGNSEERITRDQARRMAAIDRAIVANPQQLAQMPLIQQGEDRLMSQQSDSFFSKVSPTSAEKPADQPIAEAPNTDDILNLNL